MLFTSWLRNRAPRAAARRTPASPSGRFRPALESLGDRLVPATLTVTTALDAVNPNDGALSLREAVAAAQKNDTINFDPSLGGATITLDGSELVLDRDVTISGLSDSAVTISGGEHSRVFLVAEQAHVRLEHLGISDGRGFLGDTGYRFWGGGALNLGTLDMFDCAFNNNSIIDPVHPFSFTSGGAVSNFGTLTAIGCGFTGNSAMMGGAISNEGISSWGDDPRRWNVGNMTLIGCSLDSNHAADAGGAIANLGTLRVELSRVMLNSANSSAGGIWNLGTLTVSGSLVNGNSAAFYGGGIVNGGLGTVTLNDSIVASNTARHIGGGIYNNGTLTVSDSQVKDNTALTGGGIYCDTDSKLMIRRSVVNGNHATTTADIYSLGKTLIDNQSDIGEMGP